MEGVTPAEVIRDVKPQPKKRAAQVVAGSPFEQTWVDSEVTSAE